MPAERFLADKNPPGSYLLLDYVCVLIVSFSVPDLFELLLKVFKVGNSIRDLEQLKADAGVIEEDFTYFMEMIPRLPVGEFGKIVAASKSSKAILLYAKVQDVIYSDTPEALLLLGFPKDGHVSGYYSENIAKEDTDFVQKVLDSNKISVLNSRLYKPSPNTYTVLVASAIPQPPKTITQDGKTIIITFEDFAAEMKKVADNLAKAIPYAANVTQEKMLQCYVESFETGSIDKHDDSQRYWIKDIGPAVESNIGFIETYQDPSGSRAAWEGFVAMVNREQTRKFDNMVQNAPKFITKLPWSAEFEKDKFNKPDFTSLEVLTFATGGIPAGINIPNNDAIRNHEGFKNVSLGNILSAKAPSEKITFVRKEDLALYEKLSGKAFEVQVGIHELLGHGSGKLFMESEPGKFNFDKDNMPKDPFTNELIKNWYKPGETWTSVFKSIAPSYEECRAECVAMYLCVDKELLAIFGHTDDSSDEEGKAEDIMYISWLQMARAGVASLQFYDPVSKKWGQAHMQARYGIMQCFLRAGQDFLKIEQIDDDLIIHLDRSKILSVGVPAVGEFLAKLQIYKCSADVVKGAEMYNEITSVPDSLLKWRDAVLKQRQPRKLFVQPNLSLKDGKVELIEYETTCAGLIKSWVERDF
ncbi:hypothetical protein HK098_007683 [Nowakowskiella sp. JEL0407]|nr:hypothetical protein HK098_007683 [Nowakowskiella sp. JEL0407]